MDGFLYTFQRHMKNFEITERYWVSNLIPILTDHLRSVYGELDETTRNDFEAVKEAFLEHFDIGIDTYRKKFQGSRGDEMRVTYFQRRRILLNKWMKECETLDEGLDIINAEGILAQERDTVWIWVRDQDPKTPIQLVRLIDRHVTNWDAAGQNRRSPTKPHGRPPSPRGKSDQTTPGPRPDGGRPRQWRLPKFDPAQGPRCFHCNEFGHISI